MQNTNDPINQQVGHQVGYTVGDEIDLFVLFSRLWQEKWLILVCVLVGLAVAGAYAYTAKEVWTSHAKVVAPEAADMGTRFEKDRATYSALSINNGSPITFDGKKAASDLFSVFLQNASMSEAVAVKPPITGSFVPYATLSLSATSANEAQSALTQYIKQVDQRSVKQTSGDFNAMIQAAIVALKGNQRSALANAEEQKQIRLDELESALDVAKRAGIVDFVAVPISARNGVAVALGSDSLFLFGEKFLTAQIDSIKGNVPPKPAGYYDAQHKINQLEPLLNAPGPDHAFTYRVAPTFPVVRDKPKRSLIMVLGILLGGMVGCGLVLVRAAYRNRHMRRI